MNSITKHPNAWVPIVLSFAMSAFIFIYISTHNIIIPEPNADEGIAIHLFQIWLVLEVLMVGFFAIKWLPQEPKKASVILGLQILAVLLTCAPIFIFEL